MSVSVAFIHKLDARFRRCPAATTSGKLARKLTVLSLCGWLMCAWTVTNASAQPPAQTQSKNQAAASVADSGTKAKEANAGRIQSLIERLGSEKFNEREQASAELLRIGEPALLPLLSAEQSRDAEVRTRATSIRERIEHDRFEETAQNFKRDPDPAASYGLPGWKSFSKVAGTSRPAKRLFLTLIEERRIVALCLENIDGGTVPEGVFEGLPEDPQLRLRTVAGQACADIRNNLLVIGTGPQPGDLISMLVSVEMLSEPPQDVHEAIRLLCNMGALDSLLANPGAGASVRKMLGNWFRRVPVSYAHDVFSLGRQHLIPETADMARRVLATAADGEVRTRAFVMLSAFGSTSDLDLIDKYIDDNLVIRTFEPIPGELEAEMGAPPLLRRDPSENTPRSLYQCRVGDVALAAAMKLAGMDVQQYFTGIRIHDSMGIQDSTVGFPIEKPELRDAAKKAYREFRAKNKPNAS